MKKRIQFSEQYFKQKLERSESIRRAVITLAFALLITGIIVTVGHLLFALATGVIGGTAFFDTGEAQLRDLTHRVESLEQRRPHQFILSVTNTTARVVTNLQ